MGKELNRVRYSCRLGDCIITGIVSIMFGGRANVMTRRSSIGPGKAVSRPVVDDDFATRRS